MLLLLSPGGSKRLKMSLTGSGLGALSTLFSSQSPDTMFPDITFPTDYNTPLLQASYVFSFVS